MVPPWKAIWSRGRGTVAVQQFTGLMHRMIGCGDEALLAGTESKLFDPIWTLLEIQEGIHRGILVSTAADNLGLKRGTHAD
eukprot:2991265-Pyramimonas_sp.AAC.1